MWNIVLSDESRDAIYEYTRRYRDFYIEFFSDTWLWNEKQIFDEYRLRALELRDAFLSMIDEKMKREVIPYQYIEDIKKLSVILVENRRIFIEYTEDTDIQTRYVTSIKIIYR